jgi:hypothetical protein
MLAASWLISLLVSVVAVYKCVALTGVKQLHNNGMWRIPSLEQ